MFKKLINKYRWWIRLGDLVQFNHLDLYGRWHVITGVFIDWCIYPFDVDGVLISRNGLKEDYVIPRQAVKLVSKANV